MEKLDINKLGKSVAVICPHDDDGIIGCGGLLQKLVSENIQTFAIILTNGSLGYSTLKEKTKISEIRKKEAEEAHKHLGVETIFLDFPDMSLHPYKCWKTPDGKEGGYLKLLKTLRKIKPETLFIPNPLDRHPDHQASYDIASVCVFQACEPVAIELGDPIKINHIFCYKVWDKLEERTTHFFELSEDLQKNKKIALFKFKSQEEILKSVEINYQKEEFRMLK